MAAEIAPHEDGLNRSAMGGTVEGRMCKGGVDSVCIRALVAVGVVARKKAAR
jgi:hypothetical protein